MPSLRGYLVAFTGVALYVVGRIFGSEALEQLGFALVALLVIAILTIRLGNHDLHITRRVTPERARVHQPVTISLTVKNEGRGAAPLLLLEDKLPPGLSGRARFAISGIESGGQRETSFDVRPDSRGRYEIGPLNVMVGDPFGLAQLRSQGAPPTAFLVHPRIETLTLPRDFGERRTAAASALRQPTGPRGEDFYTLREYAEGDELRKIHWPSTAKRGKLMIRQEETPWHTRATIVLDDRRFPHEGVGPASSFERAVEGAASLLDLYYRSGYGYRLAGAHHPGITTSKGSAHYHRCLDLLAVIQMRGPRTEEDPMLLARLAEIEARGAAEETLVVLTGTLTAEAAGALARCRRFYKQVVVISWPAHRFGSASTKSRWEGEAHSVEVTSTLMRSGVRPIVLGPGERLGPAWTSTSGRSRGGDHGWAQKPELV